MILEYLFLKMKSFRKCNFLGR